MTKRIVFFVEEVKSVECRAIRVDIQHVDIQTIGINIQLLKNLSQRQGSLLVVFLVVNNNLQSNQTVKESPRKKKKGHEKARAGSLTFKTPTKHSTAQ